MSRMLSRVACVQVILVAREPGLDLRGVFVVVHAQYLEAARLEARVGRALVRKLSTARAAPRRPEVEEHVLAAELRELVLLAVEVREVEVGHFAPDAHLDALVV